VFREVKKCESFNLNPVDNLFALGYYRIFLSTNLSKNTESVNNLIFK